MKYVDKNNIALQKGINYIPYSDRSCLWMIFDKKLKYNLYKKDFDIEAWLDLLSKICKQCHTDIDLVAFTETFALLRKQLKLPLIPLDMQLVSGLN